jgi:hypothetical protein
MEYIKHIKGNLYDIQQIKNKEEEEIFISKGYSQLEEKEKPLKRDGYIVDTYIKFDESEGKFYRYWIEHLDTTNIEQSISVLKQQLSDSDYKVIKNMEAQLVNEELPYNSVTLHTERQALRDKINELEELLKNN